MVMIEWYRGAGLSHHLVDSCGMQQWHGHTLILRQIHGVDTAFSTLAASILRTFQPLTFA